MKSAVVITTALLLALALIQSAPRSLAQDDSAPVGLAHDDSEAVPASDQDLTSSPCPQVVDGQAMDSAADATECPAVAADDPSLVAAIQPPSDSPPSTEEPPSSDSPTSADEPILSDTPASADASPVSDSPPVGDATSSAEAPSVDTSADATPVPPPTDTPVPVPTDTPVPPPTETPTPLPTDTPTPVPVPTDTPIPTPTATSSSKDVPQGTLSRQLAFSSPGDTFCDLLADTSNQPPCDPQTFPAVVTIQFSPGFNSVPFAVQVDSHPPETSSATSWDFLSAPGSGSGPGDHTIKATETRQGSQLSLKLRIKILPATTPHLLVYPRTVSPGSKARVWLAGYPPNTTFPLGLYRKRQDCAAFAQTGGGDCYELANELGNVTTNAAGTASKTFPIAANEPKVAHLVATPNMKIDAKDPFTSLQTYGKPWFSVDQ